MENDDVIDEDESDPYGTNEATADSKDSKTPPVPSSDDNQE